MEEVSNNKSDLSIDTISKHVVSADKIHDLNNLTPTIPRRHISQNLPPQERHYGKHKSDVLH